MSSIPENPTESSTSPAVNRLKELFGRMLRVTTSDGRLFLGDFAGTDKPLNILLLNVEEYRLPLERPMSEGGRFVGQIMIPWRLVTKVEAVEGQPPVVSTSGFDSNLFI